MAGSFIVQPYRRSFLKDYQARYGKDCLDELWDDRIADVLLEQGFSIKESPRSVYRVEKLYKALDKYSPENAPFIDMNDEHIREGITFAYACFANHGPKLELKAFTPQLVHNITSNHSGSAGLTNYGKKKHESEYRAYERGLQQLKGEKKPEPCIAFKRTQFDDKTRLVWGYPYAMTAIEGIFARPLINQFKSGGTPMAFGTETGVLGAKLRVSGYHNRYAYTTDVSSFDASAPKKLIEVAFNILATWFDLEQVEPTSGVMYAQAYEMVRDYFIHTPIIMPDLNVYKGKKHGVPSGSYFTQLVDTIINVIYVGAISHRFNLFVGKEDVNVLGDDVIFWSNRKIALEYMTQFASQLFSVEFNLKKSKSFRYDEIIRYLGRDWDNGVPTIELDEILIRMTQPESYRKYPKDPDAELRQIYLTLLSYCAVYNDAYPILIQALGDKVKWYVSETNIEEYIYKLGEDLEIPDTVFSGLERYRRKYLDTGEVGNTPLALQFWK